MSEVRGFPSVLKQAAVTLLLAGGLALGGSAQAASFTNGDFESGVLEPWITFLTSENGSIGTPSIVNFDIDGAGDLPTTLALQLNAGQVATANEPEGGGISQTAFFLAGDLFISVDIAVDNPNSSENVDGGLFELLFDGVAQMDTVDFGSIGGLSTKFGVLVAAVVGVSEGMHTIAIRVTRPFRNSDDPDFQTPLQYVDNVELSGNAVIPEPGSALLLAGALLGLATLRKRSRNRA
ncbi:MAG: PEP-CTERM sorting domain-containing protein [Deltaproteobacteria bacterium]|nr:PEP-CTERM sorting domain-containing protein [Deltaproteobacteria bacterium]